MKGHAEQHVGIHCELVQTPASQLKQAAPHCIYDFQLKKEDCDVVGEVTSVGAQIVLKCLYAARIGQPDLWWAVNTSARAVAKWNRVCGNILAISISCMHFTADYMR